MMSLNVARSSHYLAPPLLREFSCLLLVLHDIAPDFTVEDAISLATDDAND